MNYNFTTMIFDLDGVIVFTQKYHYLGWKKLAEEEGWEFDEVINNKLRGVSRMEALEVVLEYNNISLAREKKEELAARKNNYYLDFLKSLSNEDLFPGAVEFIKGLRSRGIKIALGSSSKNAASVLEKLAIMELFDVVVTGNDIKESNKGQEVFLLAAEKLGTHPLNCIVFEDTETGVKAALAAGMKCMGVGTGDFLTDAEETILSYDEIDIDVLLETGNKQGSKTEPWAIVETEINPKKAAYWESIFALSNGYMGIRGTYDAEDEKIKPFSSPGMCINSIYDYSRYYNYVCNFPGLPERYHSMLNLCNWTIINLEVEGEKFNYFSGNLSSFHRELDMKNGVLNTSFIWESPMGRRVRVESTRLTSMVRRHSAVLHYEVTPLNFSGSITLESVSKDPVNSDYSDNPIDKIDCGLDGNCSYFVYSTKTEGFKIFMALGHELSKDTEESVTRFKENSFESRMTVVADVYETVSLDKYGSFYTSFEEEHGDIPELSKASLNKDMKDGMSKLLEEQKDFWKKYWKIADIIIEGNVGDQQMMRFNLFHLRSNHPEDERMSISATGMTGNHYGGLVFWDTEMYMLPHFNYTKPELARQLLMYRYNILDKAREHALQLDGKGALYAWMSISGEETNAIPEHSTAQYHLNADIAYAIWRYFISTRDEEFLYKYGAEIVFETSRFLVGIGAFIPERDGQYCLNSTCGPDEYGFGNNNTYTNMMVQFHFNFALEIYETMKKDCPEGLSNLIEKIGLKQEELILWKKASDEMFINFNEKRGIHAQDDAYLFKNPVDMKKFPRNYEIRYKMSTLNMSRYQLTKQADVVLLMFILGEKFSMETKCANYKFYEPRTNHGSSLSPSIHSIIASEIGLSQDAYDFFHQSLYIDVNDLRRNTHGGIHFACLGGTWMAMVNGFAGMRDYENKLIFEPKLPKEWSSYKFKLLYRGSWLEISVDRNNTEIKLISGRPVCFELYGKEYELVKENQCASYSIK